MRMLVLDKRLTEATYLTPKPLNPASVSLRVPAQRRAASPDWLWLGSPARAIYGSRKLDLDTTFPKLESSMPAILARVFLGLLLMIAGCAPTSDDTRRPGSQRERDSVLGASQLPGARGVRGALGAADSATARNSRLDSVANQP
jgi:hypothetical protein